MTDPAAIASEAHRLQDDMSDQMLVTLRAIENDPLQGSDRTRRALQDRGLIMGDRASETVLTELGRATRKAAHLAGRYTR
jgi:hypothetical protein